MANQTWRVLPHRPIEKLSDRLWRVEGDLAHGPLKRVMTVIKRADGGLVIHNAIAVDDAALAELATWGEVRMLVVPSGSHRLDAPAFHARFPAARVVCPSGARAKVEQVVKVDAIYEDVATDDVLAIETLEGCKAREGVLVVRGGDGASLVLNDIVFNMPHQSGVTGFLLRRLTRSTGGPRVPPIARWLVVADKRAVRAHLERLAAIPDLRRIVVSHHETIDREPARVLAEVAATL